MYQNFLKHNLHILFWSLKLSKKNKKTDSKIGLFYKWWRLGDSNSWPPACKAETSYFQTFSAFITICQNCCFAYVLPWFAFSLIIRIYHHLSELLQQKCNKIFRPTHLASFGLTPKFCKHTGGGGGFFIYR